MSGARASRPGRGHALALLASAVAAALVALWPGIGWGTPSDDRLALLLPDRDSRPADLAVLEAPAVETTSEGRPFDAERSCVGPIDIAVESGPATWLRWEMIPYLLGSDDPDEMETFASIGKLFRDPARLDARSFLYGHVYLVSVAAAEGLAVATRFLPRIPGRADLLARPDLMRRVYIAGRCASALAATLLVVLVALVLSRAGCGFAGSLAGALGTIGPMMVAAAHVSKPHAFASLFGFLAIGLAWFAADEARSGLWAGHAASLAVAVSASPPYAVLALSAPMALLASKARMPGGRLLRLAALWAAIFMASVVILNPLALLHPDLFAANAAHHLSSSGWGYGVFDVSRLLAFPGRLVLVGLAPAAVPLALAGVAVALRRRAGFPTYLAGILALTGVALGAFIGVVRIALVLAPLAAALGAVGVDALGGPDARRGRAAGLALAFGAIGLSLVDVAAMQRLRSLPDARDRAGAWLNGHVPSGGCVALTSGVPLATFAPRFALQEHRLRLLPLAPGGPTEDPGADAVVLSAADLRRAAWLSRPELLARYSVVARFADDDLPGWLVERWTPPGRRQMVILARDLPADAPHDTGAPR